jgi:diacylglycerol kinase
MRVLLLSLQLGLALGAWTAPTEAEFNYLMITLLSVIVADVILSAVSHFVNNSK